MQRYHCLQGNELNTVPPSTARVRKLRERRSKGVAMVASVEVGEGGIDLLVGNGLLDQGKKNDRYLGAREVPTSRWPVDRA